MCDSCNMCFIKDFQLVFHRAQVTSDGATPSYRLLSGEIRFTSELDSSEACLKLPSFDIVEN